MTTREPRIASLIPWLVCVASVVAFVSAGWFIAPFRGFLGDVGGSVPFLGYGLAVVCLVGALARARLHQWPPWLAAPQWLFSVATGLAASAIAFLVPLFSAWNRGPAVLIDDSQTYLGGAERALFFGSLDDWNSRRPLNALFLGFRLAVTGLDLRVALVLQAIVLGAACFLAARVVARRFGFAAGLALFVGIYAFSAPNVTIPTSEALGVTFGCIALATLWVAVDDKNRMMALVGIFFTMVALDVRQATPLLPVVLAVWFARTLRSKGWLDLRMLAYGLAVVVVGFSMNFVALAVGNGNPSGLTGNAGIVPYGMARGVSSWDPNVTAWSRVLVEHPEIHGLRDAERGTIVNTLARREVLNHPVRYAKTVLRSGLDYGRIAYGEVGAPFASKAVRYAVVIVGALTAVIFVVRRRRVREGAIDLLLLASVAISVPVLAVPLLWPTWMHQPPLLAAGILIMAIAVAAFGIVGSARLKNQPLLVFTLVCVAAITIQLPFAGINSVRVLAALVPFMALPLACAAASLAPRRAGVRTSQTESSGLGPPRAAVALGAGILVLALVGAPIAMALVSPDRARIVHCSSGGTAKAFLGGTSVRLTNADTASRRLDETSLASLAAFPKAWLDGLFGSIKHPTTVMDVLDTHGNDRILLLSNDVPAPRDSILYVCGRFVDRKFARDLNDLYWMLPADIGFVAGKAVLP